MIGWLSRLLLLSLVIGVGTTACRHAASAQRGPTVGAPLSESSEAISSDAHPSLESTTPFERQRRKAIGREAERLGRLDAVRDRNRRIAERWRASAPERLRDEARQIDREPEPPKPIDR